MAEPLNITDITLRLVRLPTRASLGAAHEREPPQFRELTYVAAHVDGDAQRVVGWGECSAMNEPTYTSEWARGAFDVLASRSPLDERRHPMAAAALEMARLDAELKRDNESLSHRLGTAGLRCRAGAVVGIADIPAVLDEVGQLAEQGYGRVKLKVAPGHLVEPVRAVKDRFCELELHVDANGSFQAGDIDELAALERLGVTVIEQPFAVGDHAAAARLIATSPLVVSADEAVRGHHDLASVAKAHAATAVAIKPPCLGGLDNTLALLRDLERRGLAASVGGMVESGLGRHLLAAVGPLPNFSIIGDLSPARRWLEVDPFDDVSMVDGEIEAPNLPGVAPAPDQDILEAHTIATVTVGAPQGWRRDGAAG